MSTPSDLEIFETMHRLIHAYYRRHPVDGAGVELTKNEARNIRFIGQHPGVTQMEIVADSGADKGLVARLVKSMVDRGLVIRRTDGAGKRGKACYLSPEGLKVYEALMRTSAQVASTMLDVLDEPAREALKGALDQLLKRSDELGFQEKP